MVIKALVAARSGSERVKNKNMRVFSGKTLLGYKLEQLKRINVFDGVVLNSNDDEMLSLAKQLGCETVKRDQIFADSKTSMSDVYQNMAENFQGDIVVYCNATNPLVSDKSIVHALALFMEGGLERQFESIHSAHLIKEFMYLNGKPINYDPFNQPRSQDLPDVYAINFAVSVISKKHMIKYKNIVSPQSKLFLVSALEAIDIDTMLDFEIAEFLFKKNFLDSSFHS